MAFSLRDYEILGEAGSGAFGTVYRARQRSLGRVVALKSLATHRLLDRQEIARFRREAQAMAALSHDNILSVFDYGYHAGSYYIVMEYIDGFTFEAALDKGAPAGVALLVLQKVADALACAHRAMVVHRDIKPGNILLGSNGRVKLADFGLASFMQAVTSQSAAGAVGTFCYMAPEAMVSPKDVDGRADIFSFGCVLYQVLSGRLPFPGTTIADVSHRILNKEPEALALEGPTASLAKIAAQCLSKDRDARPSLDEVRETLAAVLRRSFPTAGERLRAWVGGGDTTETGIAILEKAGSLLRKRLRRTMLATAATAGVALVAVAAMIIVRLAARAPEPLPDILPGQSAFAVESHPSTEANMATEPAANGAPAPLTSAGPDLKAATLIMIGVHPSDTILVNDVTAYIAPAKGAVGVPLAPGHNRLEVRGRASRRFVREVEALPYQVIDWALKQEKAND